MGTGGLAGWGEGRGEQAGASLGGIRAAEWGWVSPEEWLSSTRRPLESPQPGAFLQARILGACSC